MKFLDLFKTHQVEGDQRQVYLSYLDFEIQKEPNWLKEGEASMPSTSLQTKTLSVQLDNKMVSTTVSKEQIMDLDSFGIDGTDQAKNVLRSEQRINLQKEVLSECERVAQFKTKWEINQDKGGVKGIRRWFWDLFGYHPEVWIDGDGFFDALQRGASEVFGSSRMGTADWVVIHPMSMYRFERSRDFQFERSGKIALNEMVSHIGNWRQLKIFTSYLVDPDQVLMGRGSTSDRDTLVSIVKGKDEWLQTEIVDERSFQTLHRLGLRTPMKVVPVPGSERSYLRWTIQREKPGLRRWLLKILVRQTTESLSRHPILRLLGRPFQAARKQ
jgi:hypothetical protein